MLSDEWLPRYRLLENFTAKWNGNGNGNGNAYDRGDYNSSFALRAVELKTKALMQLILPLFPLHRWYNPSTSLMQNFKPLVPSTSLMQNFKPLVIPVCVGPSQKTRRQVFLSHVSYLYPPQTVFVGGYTVFTLSV